MDEMQANARSLEREIAWFSDVLATRFNVYFLQGGAEHDICDHAPPDLEHDPSMFARTVLEHKMNFDERIVMILAMLPHVRPQALDLLFAKNKNTDQGYTEFGGFKGKNHGGLLPTCETAAFILAGDNLRRRFEIGSLFQPDHFFTRRAIIRLEQKADGEPLFSAPLVMETGFLNLCTTGQHHKPDYSAGFSAKLITTPLGWEDLVLAPEVMDEIENIKTWLAGGTELMRRWNLEKTVKPGYRALFHGPPGTGKTLTATLLGASSKVDVYRIDLSKLVSKYIGETEKNLANIFDQAQNRNWILFFDEADALFGKRSEGSTSNDRHSNQETAYLLQRIEEFPGVVILATNFKSNIDDAFARRFQTSIYFPVPDALQRLRLWQGIFPGGRHLAADVDLVDLAENHILTGGALTNVVRYAAIRAGRHGREMIARDDLLRGIKKESIKEGRTL